LASFIAFLIAIACVDKLTSQWNLDCLA
jgi:hypothetical protein